MKKFTDEERGWIQTAYRDAKNKDEQIEILAQLNACEKKRHPGCAGAWACNQKSKGKAHANATASRV